MVPCKSVMIRGSKLLGWFAAVLLFAVYTLTAPQNHSEAEDVYDFALQVEQGSFADQTGVNRVLALPMFGSAYRVAQSMGYSGRAFPFMVFINRLLAVVCLFLFFRIFGATAASPSTGVEANAPPRLYQPSTTNYQLTTTLLLAFSYGFWRYANEAETYVLASFLVLSSWFLVLKGKVLWGVGVSALGILIHLLNLIPLLLIIPLYYLLSRDWKKALLHGAMTGILVLAGYAACSPWLDISELGSQHHGLEGGLSLSNLVRGGIAFGQNLVSANFLFGFESFRELLANLFPSRMLDEEFYMASKMGQWIPWTGGVTLVTVLGVGVWVCVKVGAGVWGDGKAALECGDSAPLSDGHDKAHGSTEKKAVARRPVWKEPFLVSCVTWLFLYAIAVIRTEAGSPELWIMALIPFWLLVTQLLAGGTPAIRTAGQVKLSAVCCLLLACLFIHNLIGGLLPVMSAESDYHSQKAAWLIENVKEDDLILTSYEPILIFYMNYYCPAALINSSDVSVELIKDELGRCSRNTYAFHNFFQPLESMQVRSPEMYERMQQTGTKLFPSFRKIEDNEFGGIYRLQRSPSVLE